MSVPAANAWEAAEAALRRGDPRAAELIDGAFRAPLLRFCREYLQDHGLAEDAVQEVLAKTMATADAVLELRVWVWTVARNHCFNVLRGLKRRRDREPLAGDDLAASMTGPVTGLARAERKARLRGALSQLPIEQREVLWLRYTEQLGRAEISRVLDLPESTVKSRLFEALRRLREHTLHMERDR